MNWKAGDHAILRPHPTLGPVDKLYLHWEGQEVILIQDGGMVRAGKLGLVRKWWLTFADPKVETYDEPAYAVEPSLQPMPPFIQSRNDPQAQRLLDALAMKVKA